METIVGKYTSDKIIYLDNSGNGAVIIAMSTTTPLWQSGKGKGPDSRGSAY